MLANMAASLILHKRITTTTAKAKALRSYIEPLITKSKDDSTHSRRVVFSYLQNKDAVAELFRGVSPKIGERPGGYTRILKTGNRLGDNADMCILELVDFNELMLGGEAGKAKTSRKRRATKKKTEGGEAAHDHPVKTPAAKSKKSEKHTEGTDTEHPKHEETGGAEPVSKEYYSENFLQERDKSGKTLSLFICILHDCLIIK
jgi:large subunit ribosomal protein L17